MKIIFQDETLVVEQQDQWIVLLDRVAAMSNAEIWLHGPNTQVFCFLLNPNSCFMMVLEEEGDAGRHSFNQERQGQLPEQFVLSNGQLDEYPAEYTYPREVGMHAMIHFFENAEILQEIAWEMD